MSIRTNRVAFAKLDDAVSQHEVDGRSPSAALLIWFLNTIYRLDLIDAQDAVCDNRLDAGIDALCVSDDREEIVLFQAKRKQKLPSTLGDTSLKEFVGSITQFKDPDQIRRIQNDTDNLDLRRLLEDNKVVDLIEQGYAIRPLFVSNLAANEHATSYLSAASATGTEIDLWDLPRISPVLDQLEREWVIDNPISLKISNGKLFYEGSKRTPRLVFAAIPVSELVKLPGIDDTRLFAQNVRLGLGKTRVNKEIIASVKNKDEHSQFLTSHNGLTIVAKEMSIRDNRLRLNHYSVCNGCQSMMIFHEFKDHLSDEMEVLVRIARIADDRSIAEAIAYRTNNQNAISLRDLRSNADTQVQLKAEFDGLYGFHSTYAIKQGEDVSGEELSNEYAGQLIMALYIDQAWNAHQKYRVFGNLENRIFPYGMTASRIRLAQLVMGVVREESQAILMERVRKYVLSKFIVLHLVAKLITQSDDGILLLEDPSPYLQTNETTSEIQTQLFDEVRKFAHLAIAELNFFIRQNGDENYDYKRDLKSQKRVQALTNEVIKGYEKDLLSGRIERFALPEL